MTRFLILALSVALAVPAQAMTLGQRMQVSPLGGTDFRVEFRPRAEETDYWCAAGLHVTRRLGLDGGTRVFRLTPDPRKRGQGIDFTLDKARSTGSTGITTFGGKKDGGMSAASATQFCHDFPQDRFGFAG